MIEAMQREEKTRLSSSRTKAIRLILAGTAVLLFAASFTALHGQGPDTSSAADNKTQHSPQEQSVRRDQAYVRKLLERGTSDAKIETSLQLTSRFTSFNSSGDFHAYVLGLIAKEKKTLEQAKQSQQPSVTTLAVLAPAVPDSSSGVPAGNATAPSNPVGINSVKVSQESSKSNAQNSSQGNALDGNATSIADSNQGTVSNPSPAVFGSAFPAVFVPSNTRLASGGIVSNSNVATVSGGSSTNGSVSGGSSRNEPVNSLGRGFSSADLLRAAALGDQSELGRARSTTEVRDSRCGARDHYLAALLGPHEG